MRKQDFYFELPPELIAQSPCRNRSDSRLLVYNRAKPQQYQHHTVQHLPEHLRAGDLLVFNNSKVIKARLYGHKASGGKVEFLVERVLDDRRFLAQMRMSKIPKMEVRVRLADDADIIVRDRQGDLFVCEANRSIDAIMEEYGHMPLPPYISRDDNAEDVNRYQTVYAKTPGSVAAPTAGLHFDEALLARLKEEGIGLAHTTLHVGAGTFTPVRVDNILEHRMHEERYHISEELCAAIKATKSQGGRVIAVGTTALRSLESSVQFGEMQPGWQETSIFIYPGFRFKICDGLMTNFHLPESSLLMLVSAFIGHQHALALYAEAIKERYRFFSYGDTSLLL